MVSVIYVLQREGRRCKDCPRVPCMRAWLQGVRLTSVQLRDVGLSYIVESTAEHYVAQFGLETFVTNSGMATIMAQHYVAYSV